MMQSCFAIGYDVSNDLRQRVCIRKKLLIPFRREVETEVALQLKGIDGSGNLYYLNPAKLRFRKYAPTTSLISSMFQTELKLRYTRDLHDVEIDNQDDLDADLYTKSDFDEQIIRDAAHANLIFSYDFNEAYRVALSNRLTYVRMTDTSYYRARDLRIFVAASIKMIGQLKTLGTIEYRLTSHGYVIIVSIIIERRGHLHTSASSALIS